MESCRIVQDQEDQAHKPRRPNIKQRININFRMPLGFRLNINLQNMAHLQIYYHLMSLIASYDSNIITDAIHFNIKFSF